MDTTQPKTRRFTRKQIKRYLFLLIGVILFGIIAWNAFLFIRPQARIDFTVYEPTKLPNGYQLQNNRSINIWRYGFWLGTPIASPFPYDVNVTQNIGKNDKVMTQKKNKDFSYDCVADDTFHACKTQKTTAGQKYKLEIDTYQPPHKTAEEYAMFAKNNTLITLFVRTDTEHLVSNADWSAIIDSLQPTSLDGTLTNYFYPGP
jgi:hypothetical protein